MKFELMLSSDSRDRPGNPSKGLETEFVFSYFHQTNASKYRFTKIFADVRYYLHLFYGRTMMFRVRAESSDAVSNSMIPFYYLSELSEDISFRGFDRGRFRDRDLIMGTLEYRFPLSRSFEAALFMDSGQVSPDLLSEINLENWEIAGGIGLRYVTEKGSVSKIEFARSKDGYLLKITLN
jgi:outer membrane protein insertion porin family